MFRLIISLGIILLAGCGRSGPNLVPVDGTVFLDEKPLAFKSLLFVPEEGTVGNGAGGFTNGDGKYVLTAVIFGATEDYEGCPPGRYRVVVSEPSIPITADDFDPIDEQEKKDAPAVAVGPVRNPPKREIPSIYTSKQTTPLVLEVSESGGPINLKLTARSR
ncbi:MAG: hypothetical protein ABGX16_00395 [Pirellulales bacterium]